MDGNGRVCEYSCAVSAGTTVADPGEPDLSAVSCGNNTTLADIHQLSNQMVEAMDTEIGRLLVEIGVASKNPDGTLEYDPNASNTMVVIIGDNA